jgi:hypothetical protein
MLIKIKIIKKIMRVKEKKLQTIKILLLVLGFFIITTVNFCIDILLLN